ncbi:MAG: hypothetical protein KJN87_07990 [Desulfofustis sp.]|nr:hypothetical protein [Desulfofustis sp.]
MKHNRFHLPIIALAATLYFTGVVSVQADGIDKSEYKITGYTFDKDAVSESESGLLFETSRFRPLMITSSTSDVFGDDPFGTSFSAQATGSAPHGWAIAAEYLPTPNLAFHGAIGITSAAWDAKSENELQSSWEANIGVVYNFFNSLAYEVHFGYMDTGDLFQEVDTYSEVESILMISNQLTLSF